MNIGVVAEEERADAKNSCEKVAEQDQESEEDADEHSKNSEDENDDS